jgi:hypothetical protein
MKLEKLTSGEISRTVSKILRRYDLYTRRFYKPRHLRDAFEERYIQALRDRVDISTFLLAEISAIEELIGREESQLATEERKKASRKGEGFADRVLEEQRRRIARYPQASFHPDAREEVRRLLGALVELERSHWPSLGMALRDTAYSCYSLTLTNLETQLRYLASLDSEGIPAGLTRLHVYLNRFPRDYHAIDREEQEYILKSAFLLHDLAGIVERVCTNYTNLEEPDRETLRKVQSYAQEILEDFRLKDFKRRR